jgi:hypothetical protein
MLREFCEKEYCISQINQIFSIKVLRQTGNLSFPAPFSLVHLTSLSSPKANGQLDPEVVSLIEA